MLLPIFDLAVGNIALIVMFGVAFAAVSLGFDQNSAAACACVIDGLLRDFVAGNNIVAIDYIAWNSECSSLFRQVSDRSLQIRWRRVRIVVMFGDHNQRQTLHCGEVHSFIECTGAGAAVADVSQSNEVLLLHAGAEQNSGHHGNHIAEMRNRSDESFVQVAEVNVKIFATGWTPRFGHVLRQDFTWTNAFHEASAQIANDRRDEIISSQSVSRTNRRCFLPQRSIDAADDLRLSIEIDDAFFDQSRHFQITIKLEHLLVCERGVFDAGTRLAIRGLARRVLRADAYLKAGAAATLSGLAVLILWFFVFSHDCLGSGYCPTRRAVARL